MSQLITLILSFGCLYLAEAQLSLFGACPVVTSQSTFDVNQYLGIWYEIKKFPNIFEKGDCVRARYALKDNGKVEVFNRYYENGTEYSALGEAEIPDPTKPAILSVKFNLAAPAAEYRVVETDYKTYSLVYSCTLFAGLFRTEFAWILSRTTSLDDALVTRLEQKLASYNVNIAEFEGTNHSNCPP